MRLVVLACFVAVGWLIMAINHFPVAHLLRWLLGQSEVESKGAKVVVEMVEFYSELESDFFGSVELCSILNYVLIMVESLCF